MTLKEIASTANVDDSTVRRWAAKASGKMPEISGKMTKARETSVAADFALEEVIAIIRAGGNDTLANLLVENATVPGPSPFRQVALSGKALEQLRLMVKAGGNAERIAMYLVGIPEARIQETPRTPLGLPVNPEVTALTERLMDGVSTKDDRQVRAVAHKAVHNAAVRQASDRLNQKLNFGGDL